MTKLCMLSVCGKWKGKELRLYSGGSLGHLHLSDVWDTTAKWDSQSQMMKFSWLSCGGRLCTQCISSLLIQWELMTRNCRQERPRHFSRHRRPQPVSCCGDAVCCGDVGHPVAWQQSQKSLKVLKKKSLSVLIFGRNRKDAGEVKSPSLVLPQAYT